MTLHCAATPTPENTVNRSDTTSDLLETALDNLMDCLESTMHAYRQDCPLSLRRHATDADSTMKLISDCRIGEPEHTALMLECLAAYLRVKSYTKGVRSVDMPALLQTVIEAHSNP